jgi:hypothetical protein
LKSKTTVLAVILLAIAATVGCGSNGHVILPPNGGNYSNASLKGSYVYQVHGFDTNGNPYRQIGVFTADGNGNITGGTDDSSANASGIQVSGTYTVGKDGTGFIAINTSLGALNWAITLTSTAQVQLIEADNFANARGTAEFQPPSAIAATLNGTYVFRLHQEASAQNGGSQTPAAEVGSLTISGNSASGSMDENVAGTFSSATNISATFNAPAGLGRGTGTLVNSSTNFTTNFVYYIVDTNRFVMLVTNFGAVGSGSAELQSGNVGAGLSGNYAFGSRGDDGSFFAGIAAVGQFSASSGVISGTEDISQDGNIFNSLAISSCYTASGNGRVVVTSASGGACTGTITQVFWMASPGRAFFVDAGTSTVEDGTADLQTASNFGLSTFAQQYSMAMDGIDATPELLSRVGVLQFDGKGNVKLNEVANASSSGIGTNNPGIMAGTYTVGSNGRIVTTFGGGSLDLVMYPVSASQVYALQTDAGTTTSGQVLLQQ